MGQKDWYRENETNQTDDDAAVSSVMARFAGMTTEVGGEGREFLYTRIERTSSCRPKTYEIDIDAGRGMRVNVSGELCVCLFAVGWNCLDMGRHVLRCISIFCCLLSVSKANVKERSTSAIGMDGLVAWLILFMHVRS